MSRKILSGVSIDKDDIPEYMQDFLKKYELDLTKLTIGSVDLWGSSPENLAGFAKKVGAPQGIEKVILMSALLNPLMKHIVTVLYIVTMGNKELMREAMREMSEMHIGGFKSSFAAMVAELEGDHNVSTKH